MKKFLSKDFLLDNDFSSRLYYDYAADLPIIDYHNHLSPQDIASNRNFNNLTEAWLEGDHYKWRAMRAFGIGEEYITGGATDQDKFSKWAEVVPFTIRNPLFHWTHLELQRYFDIHDLLTPESSDAIYERCNIHFREEAYSCQGLLSRMNVESLCTTDDPVHDLSFHREIRRSEFKTEVYPTFRPDRLYAIDATNYLDYVASLSEVVGFEINTFEKLLEAASLRIDFFDQAGGRLADHAFEQLYDVTYSLIESGTSFSKVFRGVQLKAEEVEVFKMTLLVELSKMYHKKGWTQQLHLGAIRNNNSRKLNALGSDTGFDSIGDFDQVRGLGKFLNTLDETDQLPKSIIYNLNPKDNEVIATMTGNFMDGLTPGKIQFGSGWWFLDQKDGIEKQINALSNMGLLSQFIGMLTDSRSFLSFPRHEYFRRIVCNLIGNDVVRGELPADEKMLGQIVQNICYFNARDYLKLGSSDD